MTFMQIRRAIWRAVSVALLLWGSVVGTKALTPLWPVIRSTHARSTFVDPGKDGTDTPFRMLIKDNTGNTAYRLECHNGNYEETFEITYSGDFHCALFAVTGNQRVSGNLLADSSEAEQQSDWFNRGRMMADQLRGDCARSPYGATRVFRLRGLHVSFRFSDLRWQTGDSEPRLQQFSFSVTARRERIAQTSTAESVSVSEVVRASCL